MHASQSMDGFLIYAYSRYVYQLSRSMFVFFHQKPPMYLIVRLQATNVRHLKPPMYLTMCLRDLLEGLPPP